MYIAYLKITYKLSTDDSNIIELEVFSEENFKELKIKLETKINESKEALRVTKKYKRKSSKEIEIEAEHRLASNSNIVDITIKQTHRHKMEYLSWANSYPEDTSIYEGCALEE